MQKKQNSPLIKQSYKAPLSAAIIKEYTALLGALSEVPQALISKKNIPGTGGLVSVHDIVAYQIGWGQLLLGWYKAGIKGQSPQMPGDGFTTWDYTALAHHFYDKYGQYTLDEQLIMLHDIVQRVVAIVELTHENNNLDKLGVWTWCTLPSGKQWPLSKWIKINTASPYKRAAGLIKKLLKNVTLEEKSLHE